MHTVSSHDAWARSLIGGFVAAVSLGLAQQGAAQETTPAAEPDKVAPQAQDVFRCPPIAWSGVTSLRYMTPVEEGKRHSFKYENIEAGMPPALLQEKIENLYYYSEAAQMVPATKTDEVFILNFMAGPKDEQSLCQKQILMESLEELAKYAPYPLRLVNITMRDDKGELNQKLYEHFKRFYEVNSLGRYYGFEGIAQRIIHEEIPYAAMVKDGKVPWNYALKFDALRTPGQTSIPEELANIMNAINASLPVDYTAALPLMAENMESVEQDCLSLPRRKVKSLDPSGEDKKEEETDERGRPLKLDKDGYPKTFREPRGFLCRPWGMTLEDFAMTMPSMEFKRVDAAYSSGKPKFDMIGGEGSNKYISHKAEGAGTYVNAGYFYPGAMLMPKHGGYTDPVVFHFVGHDPTPESQKKIARDMRFHAVEMVFHADGVHPDLQAQMTPEDIKRFDTRGKKKSNFHLIVQELLETYGKPAGYKEYMLGYREYPLGREYIQQRFVHLVWEGKRARVALLFDRDTGLGSVLYADDIFHDSTEAHFNAGAPTDMKMFYPMLHYGSMEERSEWRKMTAEGKVVPVPAQKAEMFVMPEDFLIPVVNLSHVMREHRNPEKALADMQTYYNRNAKAGEGVIVVFDRENVESARYAAKILNAQRKVIHHIIYAQAKGEDKAKISLFVTPPRKSSDPRQDTSLDDYFERTQAGQPIFHGFTGGNAPDIRKGIADMLSRGFLLIEEARKKQVPEVSPQP